MYDSVPLDAIKYSLTITRVEVFFYDTGSQIRALRPISYENDWMGVMLRSGSQDSSKELFSPGDHV